MPGKVVKTKSGLQGRTRNDEPPYYQDVMVKGWLRSVLKVRVYLDNGTKMICTVKDLEPLGNWD